MGALRDGKTSYAASEGLPEAREAIRRDAEETKGIDARFFLVRSVYGRTRP